MRKLLLALFASCLFSVSFAQTSLTTAVDFTVTDVHGNVHNLFDYLNNGQYVLLDFFFTTCPPCIASVPDMNTSYQKYGCNNGDVIYLSIDQGDTDAQVLQYELDYGGLQPSVSGVEGGGNAVNAAYGISAFPTVILIAPDQSIVEQDIFPVTQANLDAAMTATNGGVNAQACSVQPMDDAGLLGIYNVPNSLCGNAVDAQFELTNTGNTTLTSVTVTYQVTGSSPQSFIWTGSLDSGYTEIVNLPTVVGQSGNNTLSVTTSMPNGNTDGNSSNDLVSATFNVLSSIGITWPIIETFEAGGFPPAAWDIDNPDNGITWAKNYVASAGVGQFSIYMNNYDYGSTGASDDLVLPGLDLTAFATPALSFKLAYTSFDPVMSDVLQVLVSDDCGITFTPVWEKSGDDLRTAPPTSAPFVPTSTQWRTENIDLSAYIGNDYIEVKFRNITSYENNLYLDDINVTGIGTGIEDELFNQMLDMYPNPASDQVFINYNADLGGDIQVSLKDVTGKSVINNSFAASAGMNNYKLELSDLPTGMYLLDFSNGEQQASRKLMVR